VDQYGRLDALVCIYRPEQMGSLNGNPTTIVIADPNAPNGPPKVTMMGGQNYCQRVTAGVAEVTIRFPRPYELGFPVKNPPGREVKKRVSIPSGETDLLLDATGRRVWNLTKVRRRH
jgi:hypothetical protein